MADNDERITERKAEFKKGITADDAHEGRVQNAASLRKQKRQAKLRRARGVKDDVREEVVNRLMDTPGEGDGYAKIIATLRGLVAAVMQNDDMERKWAALEDLRVITVTDYMLEDVYCTAGFVQLMVSLARTADVQQSAKAIFILINLTMVVGSTEICAANGVPELCAFLLNTPEVPVVIKSEVCWLVANFAAADWRARDRLVELDVHLGVTACIDYCLTSARGADGGTSHMAQEANDLYINAYWALRNFYTGHTPPDYERLAPTFPALVAGLSCKMTDSQIPFYATFALQHALLDRRVQEWCISNQVIVNALMTLCVHPKEDVQLHAARAIGNISTYRGTNDDNSDPGRGIPPLGQVLMAANITSVLVHMIDVPSTAVRHEACFICANYALSGFSCYMDLKTSGVLKILFAKCATEVSKVKGEATRVVSNVVHACLDQHADPAEYAWLVNGVDVIGTIAPGLSSPNSKVRMEVVIAYEEMLKRGTAGTADSQGVGKSRIAALIEECGALDRLTQMINQEPAALVSDAVERVVDILQDAEDEMEVMEDAPPRDKIGFGTPLPQHGGFAAPFPVERGGFSF